MSKQTHAVNSPRVKSSVDLQRGTKRSGAHLDTRRAGAALGTKARRLPAAPRRCAEAEHSATAEEDTDACALGAASEGTRGQGNVKKPKVERTHGTSLRCAVGCAGHSHTTRLEAMRCVAEPQLIQPRGKSRSPSLRDAAATPARRSGHNEGNALRLYAATPSSNP